nr:hypothetical protein [uncultured Cardiobacterium sp.]
MRNRPRFIQPAPHTRNGLFGALQHRLRLLKELRAQFVQQYAAPTPVQQGGAERVFQPGQATAQARFRHTQQFTGLAQTARAHDSNKQAHIVQINFFIHDSRSKFAT